MADDFYDSMFEELKAMTPKSSPNPNEAYWRKKLAGQGELKASPPLSPWRRIMRNIEEGMRQGPGTLIAGRIAPLVETGDNKTYTERRKAFAAKEKQRREDFAAIEPPDSVGDYAADLTGNIIGSLISDPTNLIGGGMKTLGGKMFTAAGLGAGADVGLQAAEKAEGFRDELDPVRAGINLAAGPAFVAGGHAVGKAWDKFGPKKSPKDADTTAEPEDPVDRRIKGLDDLANHPDTPKHEAAAASRMAEKLRAKYGRPGQPIIEDFDFSPPEGRTLGIEDAASFGKKFGTVTSTKRSAARNKAVGGVANSYHLTNRAMDIARKPGVSHKKIESALRAAGYNIVESIDEGDHSHFAFDFKKSAPVQQPDDLGDIRLVQDELPAIDEMARVNEELSPNNLPSLADLVQRNLDLEEQGIPNLDVERMLREFEPYDITLGATLREADDSNVIPFPKEKLPELTEDELRDVLAKKINQEYDNGTMSNEELDNLIKQYDALVGPQKDLGPFVDDPYIDDAQLREIMEPQYDDVLTPAERQEMDASAVRPNIPPTVPAGLGKGTVATTPVNDLDVDRSVPPASPRLPPRPGEDAEGYSSGGPFGGDGGGPVEPDALLPITLEKLVDAVKVAKKAGPEHRRIQREERSRRFAEVGRRRQYTSGAVGHRAEKAALKGELPRKDLEGIRHLFSQEEQDALLDALKNSRLLSMGESIHARDAIEGLMDGRLPTPSELSYLDRVFPVLVEQINKKAPFTKKVERFLWKAYETSRGQMGSGDISFGGRQGLWMFSRPEWWKATWGELHALSPTEGKQVLQDQTERIVNSEHYERLKTAGVKLMDLGDHGSREEFAPHGLIEDIPYVGGVTKASNRAYTYMSNELRFQVAHNRLEDYKNKGADIDDPKFLKTFGEYINTFTGRGNFPKVFGFDFNKSRGVSMGANLVAFAPKFVMSTLQRLNPLFWARMAKHPLILKSALRDTAAYGLMMFSLLYGADKLLKESGYEVDWDPRKPTGLKIKHGNTTYDFGGGMVQTASLISKLLTNIKYTGKGEEKRLDTDEFGGQGVWDTVTDWARTKLHPSLSYVVNAREGKNVVGEEFNWLKDTAELIFPMYSMSLSEHLQEHGPDGMAAALPIALGASIQTYKPKEKKEKEPADPLDKMFKDLEKGTNVDDLDKMFEELE